MSQLEHEFDNSLQQVNEIESTQAIKEKLNNLRRLKSHAGTAMRVGKLYYAIEERLIQLDSLRMVALLKEYPRIRLATAAAVATITGVVVGVGTQNPLFAIGLGMAIGQAVDSVPKVLPSTITAVQEGKDEFMERVNDRIDDYFNYAVYEVSSTVCIKETSDSNSSTLLE